MARQRAGQAAAAFGRVGQVQVSLDGKTASISASENDSIVAGDQDSINAGVSAAVSAISSDVRTANGKAGRPAVKKVGKKAGRAARRVGRPRGPDRVPLTIRIIAENDARLTAAVEQTGQSPQYIVDAALSAYFDALGL
jgi:hypothetical protein